MEIVWILSPLHCWLHMSLTLILYLKYILALVMKNLKRNICIRYNICKFFEEFKNRWRLLSTANIIWRLTSVWNQMKSDLVGYQTEKEKKKHQGIFSTQGFNLGLPHCRQTLYHLSHQGSPRKPQPRENHNSNWPMYPNVHCSTIYNSQGMETNYMSNDRWVRKEGVIQIYKGVFVIKRNETGPFVENYVLLY